MIAICIVEDRTREEVAIKLLLLSLAQHCPDARIFLTYPPATLEFRDWLTHVSRCELRTERISGFSGWNVKAAALLELLAQGYPQVWWIDSDIIVTGDFLRHYESLPEEHLVVCEEALYGGYHDDGYRTKNWDLDIGRRHPHTLNSAVIRVTQKHVPLLRKWMELLDSDDYRAAQDLNWINRPKHMLSDQDSLSALLGSTEFAHIPLRVLQRGRDIIQYFGFSGYTTLERLRNLFSTEPAFVHCQGWKPWEQRPSSPEFSGARALLMELLMDLSPYCMIAQRYADRLGEPIPWLETRSRLARILQLLGCGVPALTGFPLAVMLDLARAVKRIRTSLSGQSSPLQSTDRGFKA